MRKIKVIIFCSVLSILLMAVSLYSPHHVFAGKKDNLVQNIVVKKGKELSLNEGSYGRIDVKNSATLTISGGLYIIKDLILHNRASVIFQSPTTFIINKRLRALRKSYIGPADGSDLLNEDIRIFLNSDDETYGGGSKKALKLGKGVIIDAELIIGRTGLASANVGDLGIVSLTPDNVFHYEIINGEYEGESNTIQLEEYTGSPAMDGHGLDTRYFDPEISRWIWVDLLKLTNGGMGAVVNDGVMSSVLISKLGDPGTLPSTIDGDYNAIVFLGGVIGYPGFTIYDGGTKITAISDTDDVNFSASPNVSWPNILHAKITDPPYDDEIIDANLICDGISMLLDFPSAGIPYGAGFGAGVQAIPLSDSDFQDGQNFYVYGMKGYGKGTFYNNGTTVSYEVIFENGDGQSGELVFNQPTCGGRNLPNDGEGWACDEVNRYAFIIDPDQGLLGAVHVSYISWFMGGW